MAVRVVVAVATSGKSPYNNGIVEAAEVVLDETLSKVDEFLVTDARDDGQVAGFLKRRWHASIHAYGYAAPRLMQAMPWNIRPDSWGECVRSMAASSMAEMEDLNFRAGRMPTLEEAAKYFRVDPSDGTAMGNARAAAKVLVEALRMREESLQGELRMLLDDGF
jgi:hypothetical protein